MSEEEILYRDTYNSGKSLKVVAELMNVTTITARERLVKLGVVIRPRGRPLKKVNN